MTEEQNQKMAKFDDSQYDVIVFDEIYFSNIRMLAKIKRYSENNPNKIILATGDTNQLETIDLVSNTIKYDEYVDHCIDTIFSKNIVLHQNKRLKHNTDKIILREFKNDIFNESIPTITTLKKFFKFTKEIKTTNNIAFKNSTCEIVADKVRKNLNKKYDYEVGEVLVCRKYLKFNHGKCSVNFEFIIKHIKHDSIVIKDINGENTFEIKKDIIKKHFIHSYCRTAHSFQGSSINDAITIFDYKFFYATRKFLYTAITRATELKNVYMFNGTFDNNDNDEEKVLDSYLNQKVENYKKQDIKKGREINIDTYITPDWLKSNFGKTCSSCGDCFRFDVKEDGRVESNLTADRVDNDETHHKNNIVPLCTSCNQKKSCW